MPSIRLPAVAGTFYPRDPDTLRAQIAAMLDDCALERFQTAPKAMIVPHAGYVYSGPVAARAYRQLAPFAAHLRTVVILGPAHRMPLRGLALPAATHFATPLGAVAVERSAVDDLRALEQVQVSDAPHALEHSLEVHLPFLQCVLPAFRVVPLVVGDASPAMVAQVLDRLWGDHRTLILVSSDLSHYLPYDHARGADRAAAQAILRMEPTLDPDQACGAHPINGLLLAASQRGLQPTLLDLRNSADTAGGRARVVGYGAFLFTPATGDSDAAERGDILTSVARSAIGEKFGMSAHPPHERAFLLEPGASFVTLRRDGRLRGCIGSLEHVRPLMEDVRSNARAAAFADPRFAPLDRDEFAQLRIEVSLLSASEPLDARSEEDALARLRPGVDGVVLRLDHLRATFLPQVWEQLPRAEQFLRELKRKAGLPVDFWSSGIRLSRYTVTKYHESERI